MKCHECRDLLSPYLDNMTSDEENRRINVHLAACRSCCRELQEMTLMLKGLGFLKEEVALPYGYTEELHEKLLAQKASLWGKQEVLSAPRAGGWLAASVAALAIGAGIWVSSLMPYAQVADTLQRIAPAIFDREHELIKPAIEKLIAEKAQDMQNSEKSSVDIQEITPTRPQQVADNNSDTTIELNNNSSTPVINPVKPADNPAAAAAEMPKVAAVVAMRVDVENLDTAIALVKSEGQNQNTMVAVVNDNSIHTLNAGRNRVVSIQVPEDQVEQWVNWLNGLGDATPPSKRSEDITQEYKQLSQRVAALQQQLTSATVKNADQLKTELQASQQQLQAVKKRLQLVTLNVTLHEELQP